MTERQSRGRTRRTLFEREAELGAVDEALDRLTATGPDAGGGLLALSGPAGLGKTTLLAEVRRRALARSCAVLAARGGEQEQAQPFHVARQLIQPRLAGRPEAELREVLGGWYGIVGPALGLRAPGQGAPPDPQGLRDGLDWVLTQLTVQHAPVVLVLDDAHWGDPESLGWLAAFAPRAEHLALLLVVAYRPDELPPHAEAFRTLPGRAGQRPLSLAPLSAAAVSTLVRDAVGEHAEEAFCREAWAVTTGNPFEAVELTARVRAKGLEPVESSAPLLRDLAAAQRGSGLVARLHGLGPSTVRFAWACAVLGTDIPQRIAARVAGLGAEEAADATTRLRDARILSTPAEPTLSESGRAGAASAGPGRVGAASAEAARAGAASAGLARAGAVSAEAGRAGAVSAEEGRAVAASAGPGHAGAPGAGALPAEDVPAEEDRGGLEFVHPLLATGIYRAIPDALRVALHGKAAAAVLDAGLGAPAAARHLLETQPESDPWVVRTLREAAAENLRAGAP
ncbi:AAA family ATPase, partial [Streptomyces sp. NPDC059564]|uniref:AAA family ATPase n=1 Tax=Streptomyces sp. NPDC059564 TaxID=3346865 RepID=UPI0036AB073A